MNVELHRFNEAVVADPSVVDAILEKECTLAEVARSARRLGYDFTEAELRTVLHAPGRPALKDEKELVRASGWTMTYGWVIDFIQGVVAGPVITGPTILTLGIVI